MKLVVARHDLGELAAAVVFEDDEVAEEREQLRRVTYSPEQHFQLEAFRCGQLLPRDRAPRLEPLAPCRERAETRLGPVGDDQGTR